MEPPCHNAKLPAQRFREGLLRRQYSPEGEGGAFEIVIGLNDRLGVKAPEMKACKLGTDRDQQHQRQGRVAHG